MPIIQLSFENQTEEIAVSNNQPSSNKNCIYEQTLSFIFNKSNPIQANDTYNRIKKATLIISRLRA